MVTIRILLNALNLYLALNYNERPMTFQELFTALNPEDRRPLRFYFITLWAYSSTVATLVCILLPFVARNLTFVNQTASDRFSLVLAVLIELIWLFYALTVFSWRVSGYLYKNAAAALRWVNERIHVLPKIFYREES